MPLPTTPDQYQRASSFVTLAIRSRRFISSFRHSQVQVVSMDQIHEDGLQGLDEFQSHVATQLAQITNESSQSVQFLHKLLDSFLNIDDEFKNLLIGNPGLTSRPSSDKPFLNFLDHSVKSLDICNELTQNLQSIRYWNRHANIASAAVKNSQINRAKRALSKLKLNFQLLDHDKKTDRSTVLSGNWSIGKHLQAMSTNLFPPRGGITSSARVELAIYTMSYVTVFTISVLASALNNTCTGISLVSPSRQLAWAPPMIAMLERIGKTKNGVMEEVDRLGLELNESMDVCKAIELEETSMSLQQGLQVLESRLRQVFRRIVTNREEVMKCLDPAED